MGQVFSASPAFKAAYLEEMRLATGSGGSRPRSGVDWLTLHPTAVVLIDPSLEQFAAACAAQSALSATDGLTREVHIAKGTAYTTGESGVTVTYAVGTVAP